MGTTEVQLAARLAAEQSERRLPSLVAGVVRGGALVWSGGRGNVDGVRPTAATQYRCGSITKTFVAVCVLRLRDEGRLALTDRLDQHLPGTAVGEVTVAQLLSHAAGLRAETAGPWWERTPGGDFASLAAASLTGARRFDPGRRFHYSNVGFAVLGELVAHLSGAHWAEVVRRDLLAPLGMERTTTRPVAPHARGLAVHPWANVVLPEPEHDAGAMAPAGQLWTTVADLALWVAFLAGDGAGIVDPDTMAEMREPRALVDGRGEAWDCAYGLGLQIYNHGGTRTFGHGGSMPGFLAFLEFTDEGDGALGFANATNGMSDELGSDLLGILAANEPRLPDEWAPEPTTSEVLAVVGPWYWGARPYVMRSSEGMLFLEGLAQEGRRSRFRPTEDGSWIGLDGYHSGEELAVGRLPDGTVTHLDIGSFIFTRLPYDPDGPVPGDVDPRGWQAW